MLIQEKSILNRIPKVLNARQIFLLEGIRYSANSMSLCYERLFEELNIISVDPKIANTKNESFYIIINDAWNLIDWTNRFTVLLNSLSTKDKSTPHGENISFLLKTKEFRNTLQHLEERIDEHFISLKSPMWGCISWTQFVNPKLLRGYTLMAGHARDGFLLPMNNPLGNLITPPIDHITLHSIVKRPSFHVESLNLSELYQRAQNIITKLEIDLEPQLASYHQYGGFLQDLVVSIDVVPNI